MDSLANPFEDKTDGPDLEPHYGEPVELEGRYEIDPISGSKRFQGCWLVLDDGTRYVVAYRPRREHFPFADKRVRVRGRPYTPGRDTQHIMATHLEVHSIELAPGEEPYPHPPDEPPAPAQARSAAELADLVGRWVQVSGVLTWLENDPDGHFGRARLRLADGTDLPASSVPIQQWQAHLEQAVTVTSRLEQCPEGLFLAGPHKIRP
ncbi:MAG: hypothetical protein JXA37_13605 [Chloroflexia bacterium]|nr:hypothetical protein [Chloroflexia bacterium]